MPGMLDALRTRIADHQVLSYFVLAYAVTWTIDAPVVLLGMEPSWPSWGLLTLGALGPLVATLVVVRASGGSVRRWFGQVFRWRLRPRWYGAAVGLPLVFLALGTALYVLAGYTADFGTLASLGPAFYAVLPLLVLWESVLGGGKEELGWRGFAQPMLQGRYGAFTASIVVGVLWALWHLPLMVSEAAPHSQWPLAQQVLWGVSLVGFSVVLAWAFNSTGSAWLAMLFHGAWNVLSTLMPMERALAEVGGEVYVTARTTAMGSIAAAVWIVALALVAVHGPDRLAGGDRPTLDVGRTASADGGGDAESGQAETVADD